MLLSPAIGRKRGQVNRRAVGPGEPGNNRGLRKLPGAIGQPSTATGKSPWRMPDRRVSPPMGISRTLSPSS